MDTDHTRPRVVYPCISLFLCGCISLTTFADHDDAGDVLRKLQRLEHQIDALEESLAGFEADLPDAEADLEEAAAGYTRASDDAKQTAQALDAARDHLRQVKRDETLLFTQLKQRLETDNAAVAARDAIRNAQDALSVERERVLAPVRQTTPHRQALEAAEKARSELAQRRGSTDLSPREANLAAAHILRLNQAVSAIESQALEGDEGYGKAAEALKEAKAGWSETQRQIADAIRVDPDRAAMVKALDEAEKSAADASKEASRAKRARAVAKSAAVRADDRLAGLRRHITQVEASLSRLRTERDLLLGGSGFRRSAPSQPQPRP